LGDAFWGWKTGMALGLWYGMAHMGGGVNWFLFFYLFPLVYCYDSSLVFPWYRRDVS